MALYGYQEGNWGCPDDIVFVVSKQKFDHHADHAEADDYDRPLFIFEWDVRMVEITELYVLLVAIDRPRRHANSISVHCTLVADEHGFWVVKNEKHRRTIFRF